MAAGFLAKVIVLTMQQCGSRSVLCVNHTLYLLRSHCVTVKFPFIEIMELVRRAETRKFPVKGPSENRTLLTGVTYNEGLTQLTNSQPDLVLIQLLLVMMEVLIMHNRSPTFAKKKIIF